MREKLTKSDVEKIREEIEHRKLVERKELIEAVKEARSLTDIILISAGWQFRFCLWQ